MKTIEKIIEEFRKTKVYQYLLVAGFQNEAEVFLCSKLEEYGKAEYERGKEFGQKDGHKDALGWMKDLTEEKLKEINQ